MADTSVLKIHQTVHGYRDGHELLASSLELTSAMRRIMLALSDLSGDGSPDGFEEYLTGYPLEEAELYAFARTWYAREMRRPGCVWTHTLLVGMDDLARLSELGSLRAYFRRPESGRISTALATIKHEPERTISNSARLDGASYEIITRLYGQDLPVLVFGDPSSQYEETIIEVWTQQWERLRRGFAFCTGSLEPRCIEKRSFDLQVIPQQRQRRTLRAAGKFSVISPDDLARPAEYVANTRGSLAQPTSNEEHFSEVPLGIPEGSGQALQIGESEEWRVNIIQDLVHPSQELRRFVDLYSVDVPVRRDSYRELVVCWTLLEATDAVGKTLHVLTTVLARAFPQRGEAATLKRAILGTNSLVRGAREVDLLHELLTLPDVSAFDSEDLDLSTRAQRLFREDTDWRSGAVAWLLTTKDLNELGHEWAASVQGNVTVKDLGGVFSEDRDLFATLLKERPALAKQEALWRQPRELQRAAVKILPSIEGASDLQDIVTAIVAANATGLVPPLVDEFGPSVIQKVLTGLDNRRRDVHDVDEWQWSAQLRGHDTQLLDWLSSVDQADSWTLAFVASLLGVHSDALAGTGNSTFLRHLDSDSDAGAGSWGTDYAAFCLALGLRNFNGNAAPLAVAAFRPVHKAMLGTQLSRRAWQWLGPTLPRPGWLSQEDWDNAEKLRRALVEAFFRYRWDPPFLRDALADEQTKRWVIRCCKSFSGGKDLLRRAGLS